MAKRRKTKPGRRGLYNKRLTPDQQEAQREDAFAAIRRLYCDALPLWQSCRAGFCRRHRVCRGDPRACLPRAWPLLSAERQQAAWAEVRRGGPQRRPPATHVEWLLRRYPPGNFVH